MFDVIPAMGYIELYDGTEGMIVQKTDKRAEHLVEHVKSLENNGDGKTLYNINKQAIVSLK